MIGTREAAPPFEPPVAGLISGGSSMPFKIVVSIRFFNLIYFYLGVNFKAFIRELV